MNELKFVMWDIDLMIKYLWINFVIIDIFFIGGDLLIMCIKVLLNYLEVLIDVKIFNLCIVCLGSKVLVYWL